MENNNGFIIEVSDSVELIEDGINAVRAICAGYKDTVGCTLDEREYENACAWAFDKLSEDVTTLRAKITQEIGLHLAEQKAE